MAGRELTYLVESGGDYSPETKRFIDGDGIEALSFDSVSTDLEELRKVVHAAVSKGRVLVCLPAPTLARVGSISEMTPQVFEFLLKCEVPSVALFVDRPGGTSLCIDKCAGPGTVFSFGEVLEGEGTSLAKFQESLLGASEAAFPAARGSMSTWRMLCFKG